jgi:hypothetical protein
LGTSFFFGIELSLTFLIAEKMQLVFSRKLPGGDQIEDELKKSQGLSTLTARVPTLHLMRSLPGLSFLVFKPKRRQKVLQAFSSNKF